MISNVFIFLDFYILTDNFMKWSYKNINNTSVIKNFIWRNGRIETQVGDNNKKSTVFYTYLKAFFVHDSLFHPQAING